MFGIGGTAGAFGPGSTLTYPDDVEVDPSTGWIYLLGLGYVSRFERDGAGDSAFATYGTLTFATGVQANDLAPLPDGGFVVVGGAFGGTSQDFYLARYNFDGTLDTGFGQGGATTTDTGKMVVAPFGLVSLDDTATTVAVQADGRIVVAGNTDTSYQSGSKDLSVARYTADGALDTSFGTSGHVTLTVASGDDRPHDVMVASNGSILVAATGSDKTSGQETAELVCLSSSGSLNTAFGSGGKISLSSLGVTNTDCAGAAIQSDGKIILAAWSGNTSALELFRFTSSGSLDTTFGTGGIATLNLGGVMWSDIALQADGKILASGTQGAGTAFALARFTAGGALDTTFNNSGSLVASGSEQGLAVGTDGEVLVAGAGSSGSPFVAGYLANGQSDTDVNVRPGDGTNADDKLSGTAGHDILFALYGDDTITGGGGDDFIDGGYATYTADTAVFSGQRADYTITLSAATIPGWLMTVHDNVAGRDGTDTLDGIQRLKFSDSVVAFDFNGDAGAAYRLYQAAFDRTPDAGGLGYWIGVLDAQAPLQSVAASFVASAEFQQKYGPLTDTQFATQLYENVLHRAPDSGGLQFWVTQLQAGALRGDVLAGFSESAENQANVMGAIQNGIVFTPYAP
jgi:uncharacterized delta-60 repeat protein